MTAQEKPPNRARRVLGEVIFGQGSPGRYVGLGFLGVGVDLAVYAGLIALVVPAVGATIVSSFLGMVTNYVVNARFNFRQRATFTRGARFVVVGIIGLVLSAGILQLMLWQGSGVWAAKVVSLIIVVGAQYVANRLWTFR